MTAVDVAGNSTAPATVTVDDSIDTTPPPIPVLTLVTDNADPVQGSLSNGGSTNDTQPTLNGTAEANVTVTIYDNGILLGTTTADGLGTGSSNRPRRLAKAPIA